MTNSIARRGQGAIAPCRVRDSVPCGVWGNAPTVPRSTNPKEAANKGAGSEASLPVTLRVRRRATKLLFLQDSVKNQKCPAGVGRSRAKGYSVSLLYFLHHGRSVHSPHRGC